MRLRAVSIAVVMVVVLVSFGGMVTDATAGGSDVTSAAADSEATAYGPGSSETALPGGGTEVRYLPTFRRWDGAWRPTNGLDRTSGEWPYLLEESTSDFGVTRLDGSFSHGKVPGASYEFLPDAVKETIVVRLVPADGWIDVPFTTTYDVRVNGTAVELQDASGVPVWTTLPFHAWDSSEPPRTWERPVASLTFEGGVLRIRLDPGMLARAHYPLFVDPTWTTGSASGWDLILNDVHPDLGDQQLRIGTFSDNFDDGTKDSIWTTDAGSWSIVGGAAQLEPYTRILAPVGRWNASLQANLTQTVLGPARVLFRWLDASNYHYAEVSGAQNQVSLKKVVSGATTTLGSASRTIEQGQAYRVKVVADDANLSVVWDGAVLLDVTDPAPPSPTEVADLGFETFGKRTKIAVDDVRNWVGDTGYGYGHARHAIPQAMRTVHTAGAYQGVDLKVSSSEDNVTFTWGHYVKAGARSIASDAEAYYVPDADRRAYYEVRVDLRTTDDVSPAVSEIAVLEDTTPGPSENAQVLGYAPWQYYVGGMVNVVSGNLLLRETDLTLPGKGWTARMERAYNSLSPVDGPLGVGWTHAYLARLTPGAGVVTFTDGDGSSHVFQELGNGQFASPRGFGGAKLVRNGDASYTMWWKDGTRWSFTSAGVLTSMTDRNGNDLTFTYDGNGRLTKAADETGIHLLLAYDANGRIVRVGDHNVTLATRSPTVHSGSWANGANAFASDDAYASTKTTSATHRYANYGFAGPSDAWITKVEACVEAHAAGDDDVGVRISTDSGGSWSGEQIVSPSGQDPPTPVCLDVTSHRATWTWDDLNNESFRVEVRYIKVGSKADYVYLDWTPVRVTTASRYVAYAYDGASRLTSVTDPMGNATLYAYDGILEKAVDRTDKLVRFVRDGSSRVTEVWTGLYNRTLATVEWEFRMYAIGYGDWTTRTATVTDAYGNVTTIEYDKLAGRPVRIDGPLAALGCACGGSGGTGGCCGCGSGAVAGGQGGGERWTLAWDGEHNWVSRKDGRNWTTGREYDWRGGEVYRVEPEVGSWFPFVWQNRDNGTVFDTLLLESQDAREFVTTFEYDWRGNPLRVVDPLGNRMEYAYDSSGLLVSATDKRGFNTTITYDAHGWRLTTTDPLGHTSGMGYDAVGRGVNATTPLGHESFWTYDRNGRVTSARDPLGHVTRYEYDERGMRTALVDANGNRTEQAWNLTWGRLQRVTEATGATTAYAYDRLGRLTMTTDPLSGTWRSEHDAFGRRTTEIDPLGHEARSWYDAAGNMITRVDGSGKWANYTYDGMNRLEDALYAGGAGPSYSYDANGNVLEATNYYSFMAWFGLSYTYDALNRPMRVTSEYHFPTATFTKTVEYTYDADGNRLSMTYPDGSVLNYTCDEAGRLTNMTMDDQTWTLAYDEDGRMTSILHPNGLELNYTYNGAGWLTSVRTVDTADGSVVEGCNYTYDDIGNRLAQEQGNGTEIAYAYGDDYALNATTYEAGTTSWYVYDANGNRLYKNETNGLRTDYAYRADSSLERRTTRSGADVVLDVLYGYDGNGNTVSKVETAPGRDPVRYGYEYDFENRLVGVSVEGVENASYVYGADGSRILREEAGQETYYVYDPRDLNGYDDIVGEVNATGAMRSKVVHGPGIDEPLGRFDKTEVPQGAWYYYHHDGLGSVTRVSRSDKSAANRYAYDDFGRFRQRSESIPNVYGFTGREQDTGDRLYYRTRHYGPDEGRFASRDPAGLEAGKGSYAYTGNNPVNRRDPSGLYWWPIPGLPDSGRGTYYGYGWYLSMGQYLDETCFSECDFFLRAAVAILGCGVTVSALCALIAVKATGGLIATHPIAFAVICGSAGASICFAIDYLHLISYDDVCSWFCQKDRYEFVTFTWGAKIGRYT